MAIKINNDIVIDNNKKFYGDGSNLINVIKHLLIELRPSTFNDRSTPINLFSSTQAIVGPIGFSSTITIYGRTSNTIITTV